MNFFSGDKLFGQEIREDGTVRQMRWQLQLVHKMLEPRTGKTIRMFECQCGTRTWSE